MRKGGGRDGDARAHAARDDDHDDDADGNGDGDGDGGGGDGDGDDDDAGHDFCLLFRNYLIWGCSGIPENVTFCPKRYSFKRYTKNLRRRGVMLMM
eukprot:1930673-Rhodomonas_salina.1